MKKHVVLITLLGSIFTSFTSAEALKYSIPFSYHQGTERAHCFWIKNCKPLPPILVTGNYQRSIDTLTFSQRFGLKGREDLGNIIFNDSNYSIIKDGSEKYQNLRKTRLYIVQPSVFLFDPCHQNRSGKCKTSFFDVDIKKS